MRINLYIFACNACTMLQMHITVLLINKKIRHYMKPLVSIIMGSTSDMKIMSEAAKFFDEMEIPFELNALSAHRVPDKVIEFAENAQKRGIKVIIAGAGGAAHLPGVIASSTILPVIGVPVRSSLSIDGWDSILSILQMPAGIPVATVALDGAKNAAILATQIIAQSDDNIKSKLEKFKVDLKKKVIQANEDLKKETFKFRV
jgi:5-(carboxyamino)imidazole ribonucleotide mutase